MSTTMFLWRIKKNISTFYLKKKCLAWNYADIVKSYHKKRILILYIDSDKPYLSALLCSMILVTVIPVGTFCCF